MSPTARLRRRAWRFWYRIRWLLIDRRALRRVRMRRVAGIELVILPGVLDPALFFSSEVLVEALRRVVKPRASVLDLGTGSGIGAVGACQAGASRVVAVDVQQVAVRCARANVALHGLESRIQVVPGDLFEPVAGERFDLIAFNPPYQMGGPRGDLDRALRAAPDLGARFASGLADHLSPGGCAVLVLSTNGAPESFLGPLRAHGYGLVSVFERDRGSETLTAWRVVKEHPAS